MKINLFSGRSLSFCLNIFFLLMGLALLCLGILMVPGIDLVFANLFWCVATIFLGLELLILSIIWIVELYRNKKEDKIKITNAKSTEIVNLPVKSNPEKTEEIYLHEKIRECLDSANIYNDENLGLYMQHTNHLGLLLSLEELKLSNNLNQNKFLQVINFNGCQLHRGLKALREENLLSDFDICDMERPIDVCLAFMHLKAQGIVDKNYYLSVAKSDNPFILASNAVTTREVPTPTKKQGIPSDPSFAGVYKYNRDAASPNTAFSNSVKIH